MKPCVFEPQVPDGWRVVQLGELAKIRPGGRLGLTKQDDYLDKGVPAFSASGQDGFVGQREGEGQVVMLSSIGARCGRTFLTGQEWTSLANTQVIIPGAEMDPRYLHAYTDNERFWIRSGSAQPFIKSSTIRRAWIALPPLREQRKIAAILSSVDGAIASTRKVIEQTERVKQGFLQILMTRGIGHTRFKQTEIGEIPEAWEVVRLDSLLASVGSAMRSGPFGSALLKGELVANGIPLLGIDNIHVEEFRRDFRRFVSEEKFDALRRYQVRPRDVVITIMGTVGRACVLPTDVPKALSSKHLWTLTIDQDRYLPELISLQLNHASWVRRHFVRHSQGGIMEAIRSEVLRSVPVPVPPLDEQRRMRAILGRFSDASENASEELEGLSTLKRGLLQDLLTGRVRVKVD